MKIIKILILLTLLVCIKTDQNIIINYDPVQIECFINFNEQRILNGGLEINETCQNICLLYNRHETFKNK
jgi:hypothetical protein